MNMKISIIIAALAIPVNLVYGLVSSNCSEQPLYPGNWTLRINSQAALHRFTSSATSATNELRCLINITEFGFRFNASF